MSTSTHPVRVRASLDPELSRWLWLVKWLLVIPHYLVLVFLWPVFVVLSVIAMFAILFTGRYPRGIFDFNVGVLRWSWRVAYYAYGALGTDRYPPFTLEEEADYPAHLEVEYPDHLSRGLALVKWWLLAIPHYVVVALFVGGGVRFANRTLTDQQPWLWSGGLIGLLVVVAAVVLLFSGRYPRSVFDLLLGMNRWVLRVAAYSALMTDRYPPFRLDMGPDEPGSGQLAVRSSDVVPPVPADTLGPVAPAPVGTAVGQETDRSSWSGGRIVTLVLGTLLLVGSLGIGAGGVALTVADKGLRDGQGFFMSGQQALFSTGYAVSSDKLQLHLSGAGALVPERIVGDVKVTAAPRGGGAVFVGIAPASDLASYLAGVRHTVLVDVGTGRGRDGVPSYREVAGTAPATAPVDATIWAAQSSGAGTQSVVWPIEPGDWAVVVMNADASSGVAADLAVGATFPGLGLVVGAMAAVAACLLVTAIILMVAALRARTRRPPAGAGAR